MSFEVPAGWLLPEGQLDAANVELRLRPEMGAENPEIVIGIYRTEIGSEESLAEWQRRRSEAVYPLSAEDRLIASQRLRVADRPAMQSHRESSHGAYRLTEIRQGNLVWFVFDAGGPELDVVHDQLVQSLCFTPKAPRNLASLHSVLPEPITPAEMPILRKGDLDGWRPPLSGFWNAYCSNTHDKPQTRYALDVFAPENTLVVAARSGNVLFADWWGGYGKLIKIQTGKYEHFYGHFDRFIAAQGWNVYTGQPIGWSGNTGTGSAHLHFEVRERYINEGISLSFVPGIVVWGHVYPSQNGSSLTTCGFWSY